jgi:hypothetical protein
MDKERKQAENNLDLWCGGDAASQAMVKPSVAMCLQTCVVHGCRPNQTSVTSNTTL